MAGEREIERRWEVEEEEEVRPFEGGERKNWFENEEDGGER